MDLTIEIKVDILRIDPPNGESPAKRGERIKLFLYAIKKLG